MATLAKMKHKHHILPKYRGGSDEISNLVELTPIQHAMYHFANWQLWGDLRDFCAYKMILGDVKNPEFRSARAKAFSRQIVEKCRMAGVYDFENSSKRGKKGNRAQREKLKMQNRTIAEKSWLVIDPKGEEFIIKNMKKFCRENNLCPCKMTMVSKGQRKQHKGWRCKKIS